MLNEQLSKKWAPILEHEDLGKITDPHRRNVTAWMLENTTKALQEQGRQMGGNSLLLEDGPTNQMGTSAQGTGDVDIFDPVLISLVRRAMPNLMAYDICGVQPMTGPTGLIFAMRARYANQAGDETFYN